MYKKCNLLSLWFLHLCHSSLSIERLIVKGIQVCGIPRNQSLQRGKGKPVLKIFQRIFHFGFACSFIPLVEDGSEWRLVHVPYFVQEQNGRKQFRSYNVDEGKLKKGLFVGRKTKPKSHDWWCDGNDKLGWVISEDCGLECVDLMESKIWKIILGVECGYSFPFDCLFDI